MEIKSVRGMNDLFGVELRRWQSVETRIRKIFSDFCFSEIRTPTLEKLEVFSRTVGDASDIVEKQMYTLTDVSSEVLALRPEGTASFMRAVVEHQLHLPPHAQKFYYYLPMFRHERPQRGRLRQFNQFGAEIINDASPEADAELIALVDWLFRALGITNFRTRLNSVGCAQCRPHYRNDLVELLSKHRAELCDPCQQKIERAPLRVLDCKNEACKQVAATAPRIVDHLCAACTQHHDRVRSSLVKLRVSFEDDPSIVRGLDYYTRSAFEFTTPLLGAQDALGGGGRYDDLSMHFGKQHFPGVGFAIGMERVMLALEASGRCPESASSPGVFLAPLGERAFDLLFALSFDLKRNGICAHMSYERDKSLKQLLKLADKQGYAFTVVVGDDELDKSEALVKDMTTGSQSNIQLSEISDHLKKRVFCAP